MRAHLPIQNVSTGFVVAIIGFFSSFAIVLQGLTQMGATGAQAASGLMFAAIAMGVSGIVFSLILRQPVSVAWSTPGVALLAITPTLNDGFAGAISGFLIAALLTILAGFLKPIARLAAAIPAPIAQALLAGILISICAAPFTRLPEAPEIVLPILATWAAVFLWRRLFAVPAAVAMGVIVALIYSEPATQSALFTRPVWVMPVVSVEALISVALPLFVITMTTQNIPGIAILRSFGYAPPAPPLFAGVGVASALTAPFGAPQTCLAALTAALCAGPDSHPNPAQRYGSAIIAGIVYCLFGVFAAGIVSLAARAPEALIPTLAGVALFSVFTNSAQKAFEEPSLREAASITFLITASGMSLFGLSAPVWGLILGCGFAALQHYRARNAP